MLFRLFQEGIEIDVDPAKIIGSGGEGWVTTIPNKPGYLAKVYHHNRRTAETRNKLAAMLAASPIDPTAISGHVSVAWPVDMLVDSTNPTIASGFVMRQAPGTLKLFSVYNTRDRLAKYPSFDYRYLHRTAANLSVAIQSIHEQGHVVGDMNESNALVSPTTLVTVIDTDSFQIRDHNKGKIYRGLVGKPEYTAPEIQGTDWSALTREESHDRFALAVLIYLILMEGFHPYSGQQLTQGTHISVSDRISRGLFVHSQRARRLLAPSRHAPPFELLAPSLRALFQRCFIDGHRMAAERPSASEWAVALNKESDSLQECSVNYRHRYGGHLSSCPWCERSVRLGLDPFPPDLGRPPRIQQTALHPIPLNIKAPMPVQASLPPVAGASPAPHAAPISILPSALRAAVFGVLVIAVLVGGYLNRELRQRQHNRLSNGQTIVIASACSEPRPRATCPKSTSIDAGMSIRIINENADGWVQVIAPSARWDMTGETSIVYVFRTLIAPLPSFNGSLSALLRVKAKARTLDVESGATIRKVLPGELLVASAASPLNQYYCSKSPSGRLEAISVSDVVVSQQSLNRVMPHNCSVVLEPNATIAVSGKLRVCLSLEMPKDCDEDWTHLEDKTRVRVNECNTTGYCRISFGGQKQRLVFGWTSAAYIKPDTADVVTSKRWLVVRVRAGHKAPVYSSSSLSNTILVLTDKHDPRVAEPVEGDRQTLRVLQKSGALGFIRLADVDVVW